MGRDLLPIGRELSRWIATTKHRLSLTDGFYFPPHDAYCLEAGRFN